MTTLLVADLLREKENDLQLTLLAFGAKGLRREISVSEINRPGPRPCPAIWIIFRRNAYKLWGLENTRICRRLLRLNGGQLLHKVFSYSKKLPCVVLTRGIKPHREVIDSGRI